MAWSWGDSFDCYTAIADAANGYWDSVGTSPTLVAGRFSGSQCVHFSNSASSTFVKTSGVNDAVHHIVVAFRQTAAITGSTLGVYFQLTDGVTAQCSVVFRTDGAILLTSGGPGGTVLDTYTGAFPVTNTFYAFEFEITINNTTGSWAVRKNGNTSNDRALGSLNTRGGTANNYANKLQMAMNSNTGQEVDDLFWRSDASSVAWMGDMKCVARAPASDASVQWSRSTGATNFSCVDEPQQNTTTDYVYDSTVGHEDYYGIASIASTPLTTFMVTTRAYMQKTDAGTRTAAAQLKSGASVVASPTVVLTTSGWQWAWRSDTTDPATGAAFTAAAVNNLQAGIKVVA